MVKRFFLLLIIFSEALKDVCFCVACAAGAIKNVYDSLLLLPP